MKGKLIVISAPSGAGKTTVIRRLLSKNPDLVLSVSCTTRKKRPSENDGIDYIYVSGEEFDGLKAGGDLLEHASVHGFYYGTPKRPIDGWLEQARTVVLDVDVQGGAAIKKQYPEACLIFISPPSMRELRRRITSRGENSADDIAVRMKNAEEEMKNASDYDFVVINSDIEKAVLEIERIICSV